MGLVAKPCLTLTTPWTVACQAPLSMGFTRQEYWNGLPFPSQGIFLIQGSNSGLLRCRWILYRLNHQGTRDTKKWQLLPLGEAVERELLSSIYAKKTELFLPSNKSGRLENCFSHVI